MSLKFSTDEKLLYCLSEYTKNTKNDIPTCMKKDYDYLLSNYCSSLSRFHTFGYTEYEWCIRDFNDIIRNYRQE